MSFPEWIKTAYKEVRPNALWDFTKLIIGGAFVLLTTLITAFWYYWQKVPEPFQAVLIVGLVWFACVPIIYVIVKLWKARKLFLAKESADTLNNVPEAESDNVDNYLDRYHTTYTENERLKEKEDQYKEDIRNLVAANNSLEESQNTDFQNELRQRDALLNEVGFLIEPQRNQKENISAFVKVTRIQYSNHDFEHHPFPYLMFVFDISNYSVFDITLDNEIIGRLNFRGAELLAEKHFEQTPPIIPAFGGSECVRVVQRLTDVETVSIEKAIKDRADRTNLNPPEIDFRDIVFTIKGSAKFPQVVGQKIPVVGGGASRRVNLEHITRHKKDS